MSTGEAGPAGREGQAGPAGREGSAGQRGASGHEGLDGQDGAVGPQGIEGPPGPPGPAGAIIDLTEAQENLASAVRELAKTQRDVDASVKVLTSGVRRIVLGAVALVLVGLLAVGVAAHFGQIIREEGTDGRQKLKCVVAVLFRQDPPACPGEKESLIREGILPQGWPSTTTTTIR